MSSLVLALLGTPLGAVIALGGVWFNARTTAMQAAAGRAAGHADRVRDAMAEILEQRRVVMASQQSLFTAALLGRHRDDDSPPQRDALFAERDRHAADCLLLEQQVVRASLLTSSPRIVEALHELRTIAADPLKPMDITTDEPEDGTPQQRPNRAFMELKKRTAAAFSDLEAATREATAVDLTVPARPTVEAGGRRRRLGRRASPAVIEGSASAR